MTFRVSGGIAPERELLRNCSIPSAAVAMGTMQMGGVKKEGREMHSSTQSSPVFFLSVSKQSESRPLCGGLRRTVTLRGGPCVPSGTPL
ncbi:hypothetical protein DNTS_032720 [Danionella cerebrum]|uniref:Uncharacterized protein n=1 Tax=Danionella cerebrum TaxID=2873325 RepID=A0A553Q7R1_9TELE|nr:hypothetical protein DNTS_032720 [Danionella translucida]